MLHNEMSNLMKELDVVALLQDIPQKGLKRGQVGTIVEQWNDNTFEVEFISNKGETLAITEVKEKNLIKLHFEFEKV